MKKKYVKPMIVVERFQLDGTIAASCSSQGYIPINYGENNCTFDNGAFFNKKNCDVDLTGPEDGNDTLCYHGPMLVNETFISS